MHDYLIEMLECPACHGQLAWTVANQQGNRIEEAEAHCTGCAAAYPVRNDIAIFLTPDLPRNDLWEETESGLLQYLRRHPDIEQQLMDVPVETLAPADQFFRALALEECGMYAEAKTVEDTAKTNLYTSEYLTCYNSQFNYLLEQLPPTGDPIVDLASGRCALVELLARNLNRPIVATDFSPRILKRNRRWLKSFNLYDQVSLLAFDARRTPFKDGAVKTLTTNLGLPNITEPANLLQELRRIVAGTFLAISHFFPENDDANATAIRQAGLPAQSFRRPALENFAAAGWQVEVANVCRGKATPTPHGVLLKDAGIDAFPVVETELEWCVLAAR